MLAADILTDLGINFRVLLVQIIAFLILFWVLNKFLFSKIGSFLETRSQEINKKFEDMDRSKKEFDKLKEDYSSRLVEIEKEAQQKIQEAVKEGVKLKNDIVLQAQDQAQKEVQRAREEIRVEKEKAIIEIREHVVDLTLKATEKLVSQTMNDQVQGNLVRKYLDEIKQAKQ